MARALETPAGSESTARTEKEASWHLGDPLPSCSATRAEYVNRMDQPEGDKRDGGSRGSLIVLRARERRAHGEEARQVELPVRGNIPCPHRQETNVNATGPDHEEGSRECNLWSPLREIRTAGSTRGDEHKLRIASRLVPTHPPAFSRVRVADRLARNTEGIADLTSVRLNE